MQKRPNVDPAEISKFDAAAPRWWDPDGEFRPLHDLNPVRLDFIEAQAGLAGLRVLDVGCGGGLLAEGGRMNKRLTETALSGWQSSFGAYLAASTALGPFYIGFADAKNGKGRFYLFIGSP